MGLYDQVRILLSNLPRCTNGNCQRIATYESIAAGNILFRACDTCQRLGHATTELKDAYAIRTLVTLTGYKPTTA